jgi:hypothetical protein
LSTFGARDIAVKREVPRDAARNSIVDQRNTQRGVILELLLLARVLFPEPSPFHRRVCSRGTDIVGEQGIMGDDIPLVGMVPKPAHVCDQLARMVHQGIVDGPHPAGAGGLPSEA